MKYSTIEIRPRTFPKKNKNLGPSYRILYDNYVKNNNLKVFRFNSEKSLIDICLY